ncbi:unnamed protein product, partial [marine sediment metagenome]
FGGPAVTTAQFALRRTDPPAGGPLLARLRQYRRWLWLGPTAPREQAYVPVTQVLARHQRQAERALEDERVPANYQHYVRHCFDSWVCDLQGAGGPTGPQPGEGPSSENGRP